MSRPNAALVKEFYPDVEVRGDLGEHDTLLSIDKARRLLGYEPRTAGAPTNVIISVRPVCRLRGSGLHELLATVDVEGGARNRSVRHQVDRQPCDVGWTDDPADRQGRSKLLAARVLAGRRGGSPITVCPRIRPRSG